VTDASSIAIRNLQRKNIVAPIEKVMTKTIGGQEYVINATLFTYFDNKPVMNKVYQTKLSSPLLASSFSASTVNGSGNFIKDAVYEERAELVSYDSYNNLLEQEYNNNIRTSYLWDYDSLLLIAEVINAPASRIAYTSFEANGKGGWTFSGSPSADATTVTGQKCYDMSAGNITKSSLPNTTYIVSYWGKNGSVTVNGNGPATTGRTIGSWTYYEHEIAGTSVTVSGNKYIDELRLYPEGAHMKTYTHIPLVGISSQCDENNRTSYFEYDVFGRLSLVRDQDKNILKKICYNYSGQREDCVPFFNTVQNQNFTRNNCASGYVGSTVTYTVPANTYSSTISQAEANLFAQADINSNGQAYANTNGTCTLAPCNSGNCSGNDKKCIEGVCETGYWACISVVQFGRAYKCTFAYCFSDGTLSTYTVEEVHTNPCVVDGCE
jgi:hypothetical protein